MKTIAQQLNITQFPFEIKDKNGNIIYGEDACNFWRKSEYDKNNIRIYFKDSTGYWNKREYDENNNEIYFKNSDGYWQKSEYDENSNQIYYENSDGYWSKSEYDENSNQIYYENSDGFLQKSEFDENNNEIYYENSNGTIQDNRPKTIQEYTMEELTKILGKPFKIKIMEENSQYLSLYDFLGKAAGGALGKEVALAASSKGIKLQTREIVNPVYTGTILLYPKSFLTSYFQTNK